MKAGVIKTAWRFIYNGFKAYIKTITLAAVVTGTFTLRGYIDDYKQKQKDKERIALEEKKALNDKLDNYQKGTEEVKTIAEKLLFNQENYQLTNAKEHKLLFRTDSVLLDEISQKKTFVEPEIRPIERVILPESKRINEDQIANRLRVKRLIDSLKITWRKIEEK
jgi:hypothetical protein